MNQVARVFIVINLLLSAGFLMAAATFLQQNTDWKAKEQAARDEKSAVEASLNDRIHALEGERARLTDTVNGLTNKVSGKDQEITDLKARLESSDQAKNTAESTSTNLQGEITKLTGQIEGIKGAVSGLEAMIERYREAAETAATKAAEAEVAKTDAVEDADKKAQHIHELDLELESLKKILAETQEKLATYVKAYPPPIGLDQPKVDGQVVRWDAATALVEINRGTANGVALGHMFDIVRGSDFICEVVVSSVAANNCVAYISVKTGRSPQAGDAATKLTSASR